MLLKFSFLLLVIFYTCNLTSQTIINMGGDNNTYPSGYLSTGQYYIKDVNSNLNNFTGTWEYINGNEKFQIVLTKVINYHVVMPDINLNYYKDGIVLRYKKFVNNTLVFESPTYENPNFETEDGLLLKGKVKDFGRLTKTIYMPFDATQVYRQGGHPINPDCRIEKLQNYIGQPQKIKFSLFMGDIPNYDHETYAGQPIYSIPNDIIMIKVN